MYFIGYDIGSSSIKVCLISGQTNEIVASDFFPKQEMKIIAHKAGWAEQEPEVWWENLKQAHRAVLKQANVNAEDIEGIGITWQMHGLVIVDKEQKVLRPSIIWCDSRAVPYGQKAFDEIGEEKCLSHLLNSPGNFTASKLAWIKENEPEVFAKIDKLMLPGDFIGMKLTGKPVMTIEGLSEGMFWDFKTQSLSQDILDYYGIPESFFPELKPIFGKQGVVSTEAAEELGFKEGTPISYRAGDQPNNAFSLNVMKPGEIAANAGTSGVIYGVQDSLNYDPKSRVNSFAHVNYSKKETNIGVLLCINGTGILNSWLKRNIVEKDISYSEMNELASQSPIGANGLSIIPFGNGAERVMESQDVSCSIHGLNFNIHDKKDILRAAQEGIVFSYEYGMEIMRSIGMKIEIIKAGYTNMFLSPLFAQTLANVSGATIELYNTDGAAGAARGAGIGVDYYKSADEAFAKVEKMKIYTPQITEQNACRTAYNQWKSILNNN